MVAAVVWPGRSCGGGDSRHRGQFWILEGSGHVFREIQPDLSDTCAASRPRGSKVCFYVRKELTTRYISEHSPDYTPILLQLRRLRPATTTVILQLHHHKNHRYEYDYDDYYDDNDSYYYYYYYHHYHYYYNNNYYYYYYFYYYYYYYSYCYYCSYCYCYCYCYSNNNNNNNYYYYYYYCYCYCYCYCDDDDDDNYDYDVLLDCLMFFRLVFLCLFWSLLGSFSPSGVVALSNK